MPRLSVWFLRAALLYLAAGITIGSLLLSHKAFPINPYLWVLLPTHIEFLLFGWTVQVVMGVSYRMLPRFTGANARGNEGLAWCALIFLNLGVVFAGLGPVVAGSAPLILFGKASELAGAVFFVLHAWARVKPVGV